MTREEYYELFIIAAFIMFIGLVCGSIIWWFKRRGSKLAADCVKVLESKGFVKLLTTGKKIPYIENLSAIEEYCGTRWITNPEIILDHHYSCQKPLEHAWIIVSDFDFSEGSSEEISAWSSATARYHQTVAIFANNDFNYPWFKLEPRSLCDFGILDRTNLELGSRFHRKYSLESSFDPTMNTLFTEKTAELLLSSNGMVVEGVNNFILIYRIERSIRAKEISGFAEKTTEIFKSLNLD